MDFGQINNPQMMALQNQMQNLFQQYRDLNTGVNLQQPKAPGTPRTVRFVEGIKGAEDFLSGMGANESDAVFDKNEPVFYMLSKDANGTPAPIKLGRFTLEDAPKPESDTVTKKDFDAFRQDILSMLQQSKKGDKQ